MPLVAMPDGTQVQMPDKPTPEQLNALRKTQSVSSGPRRISSGAGGKRMSSASYRDYPELPFNDRTVVAAMDKPEEAKAYLERKYGEGSVTKDKHGFVVTAGDKKMRVSTGFAAEVTAQSPELVLGTAGAIGGSAVAGPVGGIEGAALGGMAGKGIKEGIKSAQGLNRQSPEEVVRSVGGAGLSMAAGEGAAKGIGLARKIPGRSMLFDVTPESKAMTGKMLAGGARPPPASFAPSARKLQRIAILAEKLSGPNKAIDRANFGYLQDRAGDILDKAGVKGAAKDETMTRLTQAESAMSFQDTGKLIQNNSKFMLTGSAQVKGKTAAYLKQLTGKGVTPEQAYRQLVTPGETDRLERFVSAMGKNSVVVQAVQQRALRELLSGALVRTENGEAVGALEKELGQYTKKQQDLLFPGGLAADVKTLAKETQFLYPRLRDPSMAGFTSGTIMQKAWYDRFYAQGYYSFMRAMIQKPAMIRRIAIGLRGDEPSRVAAKKAIKEMFYFGALETNRPSLNPDEGPELKK